MGRRGETVASYDRGFVWRGARGKSVSLESFRVRLDLIGRAVRTGGYPYGVGLGLSVGGRGELEELYSGS